MDASGRPGRVEGLSPVGPTEETRRQEPETEAREGWNRRGDRSDASTQGPLSRQTFPFTMLVGEQLCDGTHDSAFEGSRVAAILVRGFRRRGRRQGQPAGHGSRLPEVGVEVSGGGVATMVLGQ